MTEREKEIKELDAFFSQLIFPKNAIELNKAVTLNDAEKFVTDTLAMMKSGKMPEVQFLPRLEDLRIIRRKLG